MLTLCSVIALAPQALATHSYEASRPSPLLCWGDYDADGLDDLLLAGGSGNSFLLRNDGLGGFEDVTSAAGLSGVEELRAASWQDVDSDGDLDIVFVAGAPLVQVWINSGASTFSDASAEYGIRVEGDIESMAWRDFDGDGMWDLQVSGRRGDWLFHNLDGRFEEVIAVDRVGAVNTFGSADDGDAPPLADEGDDRGRGEVAAGSAGQSISGAGFHVGAALASTLGGVANALVDQAVPAGQLRASSVPTLGQLFPVSESLFIGEGGRVGIGTTSPDREFQVAGDARAYSLLLQPGTGPSLSLRRDDTVGALAFELYIGGPNYGAYPLRLGRDDGSNSVRVPGHVYLESPLHFPDGSEQTSAGGGGGLPSGVIAMWSGLSTEIPAGWVVCDGSNNTPDLQARFVVGAGSGDEINFNLGTNGGSTTHTHTGTTEAEDLPIPAGNSAQINIFTNNDGTINSDVSTSDHEHSVANFSQDLEVNPTLPNEHLPPYYVLTFIMKL